MPYTSPLPRLNKSSLKIEVTAYMRAKYAGRSAFVVLTESKVTTPTYTPVPPMPAITRPTTIPVIFGAPPHSAEPPRGEYHILGRVNDDRQVKIRGMRTELWEIENSVYAVLKAIDEDMFGISLVVVVYYPTESVLAAYMMASGPRIEKAVGEKIYLEQSDRS